MVGDHLFNTNVLSKGVQRNVQKGKSLNNIFNEKQLDIIFCHKKTIKAIRMQQLKQSSFLKASLVWSGF